jgi:hypothetical protein
MRGGGGETLLSSDSADHDLGFGVQLGAIVKDPLHQLNARVDVTGKAAVLSGALQLLCAFFIELVS